MPTEGDTRLTRNIGILLPKEKYWDDTRIEAMELAEFQDRDEGRIQEASKQDTEIQAIRRALESGTKEMKGVALGLCQWKDECLWYQKKIWIPNDEGVRTTIIYKCHDTAQVGHGGMAKTTELVSRPYYWPGMRE